MTGLADYRAETVRKVARRLGYSGDNVPKADMIAWIEQRADGNSIADAISAVVNGGNSNGSNSNGGGVSSLLNTGALGSYIQSVIDDRLSQTLRLHVPVVTDKGAVVSGPRHTIYADTYCYLRNGSNVCLYGPSGTGKTHLASQLAEGLGLPLYVGQGNLDADKFDLLGFRSQYSGEYIPSAFYEAAKHGGLYFLDEFDLYTDAFRAPLNGALSNGIASFPNGETVTLHKDFRCLVAMNTAGFGASGGYQRESIDRATRDRFIYLHMDYDNELELAITPSRRLAQIVINLRRVAVQQGIDVTLTPRAHIEGGKYLHYHSPGDATAFTDRFIFKGLPEDLINQLISNYQSIIGYDLMDQISDLLMGGDRDGQ